jgi:hypothetical protein
MSDDRHVTKVIARDKRSGSSQWFRGRNWVGGRGDRLSVPGNVRVEMLSRRRNQVPKAAVARRLCGLRHVEH